MQIVRAASFIHTCLLSGCREGDTRQGMCWDRGRPARNERKARKTAGKRLRA